MRKIEQISISAADRQRLERLVRDRNTPQKVVWRARIVLLASAGLTAGAIATAVDKSVLSVRRWRRRYTAKGVDGLLKDATRPSRVKPLTPEKIKQVVHMTLHEKPPNATQWSLRSMAAAVSLSYSSVQRIWQAHGLKPHLVETFKISRDKYFAAKVEDVVGLYLNPPDKALVLCVDEKSQIQALDRTQPGLPMKKGRYPQPHPPWCLQKRRRTQERHHGIPGKPQRRSQALRLDQIGGRNPRKSRPCETSVRVTTLALPLSPRRIYRTSTTHSECRTRVNPGSGGESLRAAASISPDIRSRSCKQFT
jgi:transposase